MSKITTTDIELKIMQHFNYRRNMIVPNVTELSGLVRFETDMLVLSPAGYATGFEIKVSKSDLKADFNKPQYTRSEKVYASGKKGFEIFYGRFKHFYYAIPEELKDYALSVLPEWAGIFVVKPTSERSTLLHAYVARQPKKLFDYQYTDSQKLKLGKVGIMRIYGLKLKRTV